MSLWTPLCCFVATIHLFSQSLSIVLRCGGLLLKAICSFSSAKQSRAPSKQSNHCLFSEFPSASVKIQQSRAEAAAHPLVFEVLRCITSQFARCFLLAQTRVWNDHKHQEDMELTYTVFDTETLDGFKGAVNRWLLP